MMNLREVKTPLRCVVMRRRVALHSNNPSPPAMTKPATTDSRTDAQKNADLRTAADRTTADQRTAADRHTAAQRSEDDQKTADRATADKRAGEDRKTADERAAAGRAKA